MKNSKELTEAILESLGKKGDPVGILIESVLEKWEAQIRMDQLKVDKEMTMRIIKDNLSHD
jgi:hypothetical protein